MGGQNPYFKPPTTGPVQQRFSITYLGSQGESQTIEIEPGSVPSSATGLPGSLLDIALACEIDIDHACGGVCACSTCHVIVEEGLESCNPSTEEEDDQLEEAPGLTHRSRLACQCVPDGTRNLKVRIPNWNRNQVRE